MLYTIVIHVGPPGWGASGCSLWLQVKRYRADFLSQLPIRYLVMTAQRDERYAGLFPPLLRLLASHHPHLCMVDDWLRGEGGAVTSLPQRRFGPRVGPRAPCTVQSLSQGLQDSLCLCHAVKQCCLIHVTLIN